MGSHGAPEPRRLHPTAAAVVAAQQYASQKKGIHQHESPVIHSLAGTAGAMLALMVVYPIDNARTRAQVRRGPTRRGTLGIMAEVIQRDGVGRLFSGMGTALIGVGVSWSMYYYLYSYLRQSFHKWKNAPLNNIDNLLASFIAGLVAVIISNPVWVINTRAKVTQQKVKGFFQSLKDLVREEGPSGLLSGLGPAIILNLNPSIQFAVYERLKTAAISRKQRLSNADGTGPASTKKLGWGAAACELSSLELFIIGAVSKVAALMATYPYQVVKSRAHATRQGDEGRDGTFRCLLRIAQREGMGGLYRGFFSKVVASALTGAIMFVTYEKILSQLKEARLAVRRWNDPKGAFHSVQTEQILPRHLIPRTKL